MANRALDPAVRKKFWSNLQQGYSVAAASRECGISYQTGLKWANGNDNPQGKAWRENALYRQLPEPIKRPLGDAGDCLKDFPKWRKRYLGRTSTPWQAEAALNVVKWLESGETEFVVINCPPGSGKSTLFTHDIPTWLVCRDRTIRIMIGSSNLRMASKYSARIRRTLERVRPLEGAVGVLAKDYGRFKPEVQDIWRAEEFVVLAFDDDPIEDKEPTVASFGMETEFLGTRANFVVWDDLVTNRTMATEEKIEKQRVWWDTEGETRLEPGGLLLLQGQRMGPEDLYSYALSQMVAPEDDQDENEDGPTVYHHIIYPAHFEDRCHQDHTKDSPPFPEGCQLDPIRLPWRGKNGLATILSNKESKYRVQYQQEDVDPANVLVQKIWVDGGKDANGMSYPGCWDQDRKLCELPPGLEQPLFSIATADPSPTKYWSVQWWIYQPSTSLRYFMDMYRGTMDAPDFLDWLHGTSSYVGIMDEWQQRSIKLGYPITHWIIENNAAQRFLLQYDYVKRWSRKYRTNIIGHNTNVRKLDEEFGIQMLKNIYQFGLCRFPGEGVSRHGAKQLITEVTHYPEALTDDCLMAQWFLEYWLPTIGRPPSQPKQLRRPSWMKANA